MYLPLHFSLNPCHNYIYKIILLHLTQFLAGLHFMPLSDALPTACSCCVLSNKYRMTTHWCLLAIICYICRSFSLCNKVLSMLSYCIKTFFIYVINIFLLQMETASELGIIQSIKQLLIKYGYQRKNPIVRTGGVISPGLLNAHNRLF